MGGLWTCDILINHNTSIPHVPLSQGVTDKRTIDQDWIGEYGLKKLGINQSPYITDCLL